VIEPNYIYHPRQHKFPVPKEKTQSNKGKPRANKARPKAWKAVLEECGEYQIFKRKGELIAKEAPELIKDPIPPHLGSTFGTMDLDLEPPLLEIKCTTLSTQLAIEANTQPDLPWTDVVPKAYHKFKRVFSEEECKRFPPLCSWDHAIDLTPTAPSSFDCRVYPQPSTLKEVTDKFLIENLRKRYIRCFKSKYASGFFHMDKKDRKL
jgi:hypothetical protein